MATEIGVEILPIDGPVGGPNDIYHWIRSFGATLVKIRNSPYDEAGRQNDINHVRAAVDAGLKVVTRPGPPGEPCGEGWPLWDDQANDIHFCAQAPIHRFYDAFPTGVGNWDNWYAHVVCNEPQNYYERGFGGVAAFEEHLRKFADKVSRNGWNWLKFVTPPLLQYWNEDVYFAAIMRVLDDTYLRQAFGFVGAHTYWNNDEERDNRMWYLNQREAEARARGKDCWLMSLTPTHHTE